MKLMKYINFEENRKIGQKVSLKKSDVIGSKKKTTLRAFATRAKKYRYATNQKIACFSF